MFPFLLEYKKVCTLLSVAFYILVLFLLYPIIGRIALMFSVVPAMVVGWGYGLRGGLVAGLLSILLNTLLLNLTGNEPGGWAALVTPEGGGLGSLVVVLVGMAIGKMSDFNRQLQQEIQYRKQTEEELAKSQESLELRVAERTEELSKQQEMLFETQSLAKFGTIRRDLQTGEGWWSDEVYRILGGVRQKQAPTFEDLLEHVHPYDVEWAKEMSTRAKKTGRCDGQYRIVRSSGEELTVHSYIKVDHNEEGKPVRLISTLLDITERKQAQEALRKSEESLLVAQEVAHFGSFERNLQTGAGWWSDELFRILGLSRQESEPTFDNYLSHVHPEDLEQVRALTLNASKKAGTYKQDHRLIRPSGEIRTVYNQVKTDLAP